MAHNPNFPTNLDIRPSQYSDDCSAMQPFDYSAQEEAIREYGIAGRVWEAAYFMNTYISGPPDMLFDPPFLSPEEEARHPTILELGSGTGIVAARCMERLTGRAGTVIATDLPEVCPLLEKNLHTGAASPEAPAPRLLIRPLSWGESRHACAILAELRSASRDSPPHGPSHIVCSDLVYFPELLAPLMRSLLQLTGPPLVDPAEPELAPRVVLAYKTRSLAKETPFWAAFGLWFAYAPVLARAAAEGAQWSRFGAGGDGDVYVFVARRRPESLAWAVPADDAALLGGVGARGDAGHKGDDTFETLLLMGLSSDEQE